jgi:hypothetical protein
MDQEAARLDLIQEGILDLYDMENPVAIKYKLESLSSSSQGVLQSAPIFSRPEMVVLRAPEIQVAGASS